MNHLTASAAPQGAKNLMHEPILDWMRGLAALLVCTSHLRMAMLVDWPRVVNQDLANKALYALTGLGHQAVVIFFVISGYLVGGSVLSSGDRFSWRGYIAARLSRLWMVVVPCLVLTLVADALTQQVAPGVLNGAYVARWHSPPEAGAYSASWLTFVGNLLFVQTIVVPVFGSNGPLWSLANEFWYYLLFPLLVGASGKGAVRTTVGRVASFGVVVLLLAVLPQGMLGGFVIWLMGVWVSHRHHRAKASWSWPSVVVTTGALAGMLAVSKVGGDRWGLTTLMSDLLLGIAVAAFLRCALSAQPVMVTPWLIRKLSEISFSLYLSHFPLVLLLGACLAHSENFQPAVHTWLLFSFIVFTLVLVASVIWRLFERRTMSLKQFMLKCLGVST